MAFKTSAAYLGSSHFTLACCCTAVENTWYNLLFYQILNFMCNFCVTAIIFNIFLDALQQGASQFEQQAGKLKRKFWWKNCKVSSFF